ncbi:MAG: sigma-70 family RNA polymerase sigma factor [Lentisphaeraceae bacterium]|nr:sigma-70 family RNA polymerase sigma factor [Lentisphaeraceae bacterium]
MNDQYQTRQTLLQRVKVQKDEKSWEEFVHFYKNYFYVICRRMNLAHHDAEEVTQQIILKLWNKLPDFQYNEGMRFRSWLSMVAGNEVKDFLRKQKSLQRKHTSAGEREQKRVSLPEIETVIRQEWMNYIATLALEKVKAQFSEQIVEIFLKLNKGASRTELALEYNLPVNTISVYKRRVLQVMCREIRLLDEELS